MNNKIKIVAIVLSVITVAVLATGVYGIISMKQIEKEKESPYAEYVAETDGYREDCLNYMGMADRAMADIDSFIETMEADRKLIADLGGDTAEIDKLIKDANAQKEAAQKPYNQAHKNYEKFQEQVSSVSENSSAEEIKVSQEQSMSRRNTVRTQVNKIVMIDVTGGDNTPSAKVRKDCEKAETIVREFIAGLPCDEGYAVIKFSNVAADAAADETAGETAEDTGNKPAEEPAAKPGDETAPKAEGEQAPKFNTAEFVDSYIVVKVKKEELVDDPFAMDDGIDAASDINEKWLTSRHWELKTADSDADASSELVSAEYAAERLVAIQDIGGIRIYLFEGKQTMTSAETAEVPGYFTILSDGEQSRFCTFYPMEAKEEPDENALPDDPEAIAAARANDADGILSIDEINDAVWMESNGWTLATSETSKVDSTTKELFAKAYEGCEKTNYNPVEVVATKANEDGSELWVFSIKEYRTEKMPEQYKSEPFNKIKIPPRAKDTSLRAKLADNWQYFLWIGAVLLIATALCYVDWFKPDLMGSISKGAKKNMMLIALVGITLLFFVLTEYTLLTPANVNNLIQQNAYVIILACGMLLCIVSSGNIDLSVGRVMGFVGACAAKFMIEGHMNTWAAVGLCLLIGIAIGAWQGFWIAYMKIPAFVVTLAGQLTFYGLTMVILKGLTINNFPSDFNLVFCSYLPDIFGGKLFGIEMGLNVLALLVGIVGAGIVAFVMIYNYTKRKRKGYEVENLVSLLVKVVLICAALIWLLYSLAKNKGIPSVLITVGVVLIVYAFITSKTVLGRHLYAMGGNVNAARLSGVKTQRMLFLVYVNMGFLAALAGLVYASRLNGASPQAGQGDETYAIASCYIGGASAYGGIGNIGGALIGALTMGVIRNGMSIGVIKNGSNVMSIEMDVQQIVLGLVLLFAVVVDIVSKQGVSLFKGGKKGKHAPAHAVSRDTVKKE